MAGSPREGLPTREPMIMLIEKLASPPQQARKTVK